MKNSLFAILVFGLALSSGCQSVYYGAMEKMGSHKRDILVDRVEEAKGAQVNARAQFANAFDEFLAVSQGDIEDLESAYDRIEDSFQRSEQDAQAVWERIDSIKRVGKVLFKEWEDELYQYASLELRRSSKDQMNRTRALYSRLIASMENAASRMAPVLDAFRDQMFFLKHNLNAQAVATLDQTAIKLRYEVDSLIQQMSASIEEANAFIAQMGTG